MEQVYDMIVIGNGPAGYTAALYAARSGLSAFISSQGTGRKPGGEILAFSSAANGTVFQVTLYRQIRTKELSLTRKLLCSVAGVVGDQCSAFVGQAFVHS